MSLADAKDPEEIIDASFDFAADLGGETISPGTPVVSVVVINGVDPDVALTLNGAPSEAAGIVYQRFKNGIDGNDYKLRCRADTSGGRRLVLAMTIPVRAR